MPDDVARIEGKIFQHTHVEFVLDDEMKATVIKFIKERGRLKIILTGIDLEKADQPGAVLATGPCD